MREFRVEGDFGITSADSQTLVFIGSVTKFVSGNVNGDDLLIGGSGADRLQGVAGSDMLCGDNLCRWRDD